MNQIRPSHYFSFFISLALLLSPLPVSAMVEELGVSIAHSKDHVMIEDSDSSYIYLGKELSSIIQVLSEISMLDNEDNSPLFYLKTYAKDGFSLARHQDIAYALEYAEDILHKKSAHLDPSKAQQLFKDFGVVMQQFLSGSLTVDINQKCDENIKRSFINIMEVKGLLSVNDQLVQNITAVDLSVTDATVSGNVVFLAEPSTATTGNIIKGTNRFIHDFGTNNTFVGIDAGNFTISGSANTGVGTRALAAMASGAFNTAIGFEAMSASTNNNINTAVGYQALQNSMGSGGNGVAIGFQAMQNASPFRNGNVAIGSQALQNDTTGGNVAVGYHVLLADTTGGANTAMGYEALTLNTIGANNTALGYQALTANTTGANNTVVGNTAGLAVTTGSNNIAIGSGAGGTLTTGSGNIYINANAAAAAEATTTRIGTAQTACYIQGIYGASTGAASLVSIDSTGKLGTATLTATSLNTPNIIVQRDGTGSFAAQVVSVVDMVASGNIELVNSTSADGNISKNGNRFIHNYGTFNTFIGSLSGNFTMTGNGRNTALGYAALNVNTTGSYNTAIGMNSLLNNTTGWQNVALGSFSMQNNTSGRANVAIGHQALLDHTTGTFNVAIGPNAGDAITSGLGNTVIGSLAGPSLTTGTNNTIIGYQAGSVLSTGINNVYIGLGASVAGESNTTRIRNIFGASTSSGIAVYIDSGGKLGTTTSSKRFKHNIADMNSDSEAIYQLRPVTFAYNNDETETKQYGLIAEEVAEVFPDIIVKDKEGLPYTVQYHVLPALLLNEVQKQQATITGQQSLIDNLTITTQNMNAAINSLQAELQQYMQRIEKLENSA